MKEWQTALPRLEVTTKSFYYPLIARLEPGGCGVNILTRFIDYKVVSLNPSTPPPWKKKDEKGHGKGQTFQGIKFELNFSAQISVKSLQFHFVGEKNSNSLTSNLNQKSIEHGHQ